MSTDNVTSERLRELFKYDEESGLFTRIKQSGSAKQGCVATCENSNGYIVIRIDGKLYGAHRLAWLYVHGKFPIDQIDHIDGIRTNNAIKNLRASSQYENMQNVKIKSSNKSGHTGVSWDSQTGSWAAQIMHKRKTIRLGRFDRLEDAAEAYKNAKKLIHLYNPVQRQVNV